MYSQFKTYLNELCHTLVEGCRTLAYDRTVLYTPDGVANYDALWLRDFSYMAEYAGECVPVQDIISCINYAIHHRRKDGWMPDRVTAEGLGIYAAGAAGHPIGEANLDNTPFLVYTVKSLSCRMHPEEFKALFKEWLPYLSCGLRLIPLNPENHLVYNDEASIHSPYGFTDTVAKSGDLFMESLLLWRAAGMMAELCGEAYPQEKKYFADMASGIEKSLTLLRAEEEGAYYAASGQCRQIDIWGIAYMLYIDFPLSKKERERAFRYLYDHRHDYLYEGQVRHLLKGEYWEKLLIEIDRETYQNGAYWATASGWLIWCLAHIDIQTAAEEMTRLVHYLQKEGSFECVNEGYQKLPSFVVSAANVYGGFLRIAEDFPEFIQAL